MNILELFAGSCSIKKEALKLDCSVFSSDITLFQGVDYVVDIVDFDVFKLPFLPEMIWASPPCTSFSIAAISHHWTKDNKPKSIEAMRAYGIFESLFKIIQSFPEAIWYIENPVGKLRKHPIINRFASLPNFRRVTVTYCQYGDNRRKPTDIWTNNRFWQARPICKNGDTCHEAAPRGSKTGTQGLKGAYERSIIPSELCKEIIQSTKIVCTL